MCKQYKTKEVRARIKLYGTAVDGVGMNVIGVEASIQGALRKPANIFAKMEFEELQKFVTGTYGKELDIFFKSNGKTAISKETLIAYKELAKRISTNTGCAYQKITGKGIGVQSDRIIIINKALLRYTN